MKPESENPKRRPSGAAGLRVVACLAETPRGVGLAELARQIGLDPGQTHRLLKTLEDDGWVVQADGSKSDYRLTGRLLAVAGRLLRSLDLRDVAEPILRRLNDVTGETVGLAEVRGDALICIDRVLSDRSLSVGTQIGDRIPLDGTATGTAVQMAWLRHHGAASRGPFTPLPSQSDSLLVAMGLGYAIEDQGYRPGVRAVAAAISDLEGVPIGALFVAAPAARTSLDGMHEVGRLTASAAVEISSALGSPSTGEE